MPRRRSTLPCVSAVTMPPMWSPGVAPDGTAIVNGTSWDWPGWIVRWSWPGRTHAPTPVGLVAFVRRSSLPASVVNASAAYTARSSGVVPLLTTVMPSSRRPPGATV